jgi:hypothetical protein
VGANGLNPVQAERFQASTKTIPSRTDSFFMPADYSPRYGRLPGNKFTT